MKLAPFGFLLVVALALPAAANEICRFRADDAENPFKRWLASQEVTCVASGTPIDFPTGLWNVFARGAGTVSTAPLLVDGDAAPASIAPALAPGATLVVLLPEEHAGVIYVPRRGSAIPVDGARVSVPADETLWLFVLRAATEVAALQTISALAAGTERTVDARSGGPDAVIGWLQVPEAERAAVREATALTSPAVRSGSREADPLPAPALLHGAFVRIRDVPTGNAELRAGGRGWIPTRRVVKVQPGVTVAGAPLVLRATGTLIVYWNTEQNLAALDRSIGACEESEQVPRLVIAVSRCATPPRGPRLESDDCTVIREETVDAFYGSYTFDDVVPGLYRAEMRFGKLPPTGGSANVAPLRVADIRMFAAYLTVDGSVTRGGEPLGEKVRISFPGGIGFAPEESEKYLAVFRPPPIGIDAPISVAACDGSPRAVVLADKPMRGRSNFDIDIPVNELVIHVSDTFTRDALPGATVKLEAMALLGRNQIVFSTTGTAGENGTLVWSGVPVRELHLTVSHPGYETRKLDPFTMPKNDTEKMDAQLVPLRGTRGKIVSNRPFDHASVQWFSPDATQTEWAELAADGTFVYTKWHMPDETMAIVSASHPLWVLHAPKSERHEQLSLRFPDATATAAFDVWLATAVPSSEYRYVGFVIGGVRVPQPALTAHQTLRRHPHHLRGSGPQRFRDLLATGPIDVLLGPRIADVESRARSMDLFALPQFTGVPRQRLEAGATDVVLVPPTTAARP